MRNAITGGAPHGNAGPGEERGVRIVDLPVSRGTGVAFGGPDLGTLYITSATETLTDAEIAEEPLAGSVFACTPGVRGIAETPFAG